jgi:hypothetical protein
MPDFNVRSDSVNVEAIMEQIRERIREKRGVDYTEQQIRELADVKLEKFLDPRGVRSDLLDQFRKAQPAYEPPELPNFAFEDATLFESHRAPIRWLRKLLLPFLKLLFNPNPLIQALNIQSRLNTMNAEREARRESARRALDRLYYELIHNLVIETTRLGIEVKNLKMRLESVSSRLEFNERRARALESVVVYKAPEPEQRPAPRAQQHRPSQPPSHAHVAPLRQSPPPPQAPAASAPPPVATSPAATVPQETDASAPGAAAEGPGQRSRRRRRRRGRRGGGSAAAIMGTPAPGATADASSPVDANAPMESADRDDAADEGPEFEPAAPADHSASASLERRPAELPPASEAAERDAAHSASVPPSPPVETPAAESQIEPSPGSDPDAQ